MEKLIKVDSSKIVKVFGVSDSNLKLIQSEFLTTITYRDDTIFIRGESEQVKSVFNIFKEIIYVLKNKNTITLNDVKSLIMIIKSESNNDNSISNGFGSFIYNGKAGPVIPRSDGQLKCIKAIDSNDLIFITGPAGTGKTFLSIVYAMSFFKKQKFEKIILCRPAVEAGENLGFLPGDLKEKIDPYLTPLYDSLEKIIPKENLNSLLSDKKIEIMPLAYMRGRTLENCFLILDEAQNTTNMQMKMFLTRLGVGSKAVITGDTTQIDLKNKTDSGLDKAMEILKNIKGIGFVKMDDMDIMRHQLVKKIVKAYTK